MTPQRFACCLALLVAGAQAEPLHVQGFTVEQTTLAVTLPGKPQAALEALIVRPDRKGRFPLALINHGTRLPLPQTQSPNEFMNVALDFASRGYAAVVVMRQGYGKSDGRFLEEEGSCTHATLAHAIEVSGQNVLAELAALRRKSWVDPDHILLLGQSTGGMAVLAAAGQNPHGVVAVLNFAGGRGSDGKNSVCQQEQLAAEAQALGEGSKIPSLWIYTRNDHYFSPELAQVLFNAYTANGAPARMVMLQPFGTEGHNLLFSGIPTWRPEVNPFLTALGLPTGVTVPLPLLPVVPPPPAIDPKGEVIFAQYVASYAQEKAFATGKGGYGWSEGLRTQEEANGKALEFCNQYASSCVLYAAGNSLAKAP